MGIVENIEGLNGNKVVNQFVIKVEGKTYFQSYESVIACIDKNGKVRVSDCWDYSTTTSKYFYQFLRQYTRFYDVHRKKDVLKLIENKEIKTGLSSKIA